MDNTSQRAYALCQDPVPARRQTPGYPQSVINR